MMGFENRHKVRITCGPDAPHDAEVYLDGNRLHGVALVDFTISADRLPLVILELEPGALYFEGDAGLLAELLRGWRLPDGKTWTGVTTTDQAAREAAEAEAAEYG